MKFIGVAFLFSIIPLRQTLSQELPSTYMCRELMKHCGEKEPSFASEKSTRVSYSRKEIQKIVEKISLSMGLSENAKLDSIYQLLRQVKLELKKGRSPF